MIAPFLYFFLSFLPSAHDFHVSKTELQYKSENEAIQISVSVFIDDLELALAEVETEPLKLLTRFEHPSADSLIADYFNKHLKLTSDDLSLELNYLGKESSSDLMATWCYLEVLQIKSIEKLEVENTILLKEFDDQRNILSVKQDGKSVDFVIFDNKEFEKTIRFE